MYPFDRPYLVPPEGNFLNGRYVCNDVQDRFVWNISLTRSITKVESHSDFFFPGDMPQTGENHRSGKSFGPTCPIYNFAIRTDFVPLCQIGITSTLPSFKQRYSFQFCSSTDPDFIMKPTLFYTIRDQDSIFPREII